MKNSWKDHFHFTRSERNGVIGLSVLIVIAFLFPHVYVHFFIKDEPVDFTEFAAQVDAFYDEYEPEKMKQYYPDRAKKKWYDKDDKKGNKYRHKDYDKTKKSSYKKPVAKLFPFNPNTASFKDLTTLGLPKKTANTLINFREKGGKFYKKTDLKKVYGFKEEDYDRLESYINILAQVKEEKSNYLAKKEAPKIEFTPTIRLFTFDPNTASFDDFVTLGLPKNTAHTIINFREKGGTFYKKQDLQKIYTLKVDDYTRLEPYINIPPVETEEIATAESKFVVEKARKPKPAPVSISINRATAAEWQKIYGIGPTYAKRIVEHRESLGGFHSVEQVGEIYGLADSTFQSIRPQLELDATTIRKININTASPEDLKAHPYIYWKKAKVLVAYRNEHGAFESLDDLGKVRAISSELLEQLKPYLTVEE